MEEVERRHILRVLKAVGGNKTTAAEILGFDRRTLYRKLERYGEAVEAAADKSGIN
jgi:two-component system response regulator HydG